MTASRKCSETVSESSVHQVLPGEVVEVVRRIPTVMVHMRLAGRWMPVRLVGTRNTVAQVLDDHVRHLGAAVTAGEAGIYWDSKALTHTRRHRPRRPHHLAHPRPQTLRTARLHAAPAVAPTDGSSETVTTLHNPSSVATATRNDVPMSRLTAISGVDYPRVTSGCVARRRRARHRITELLSGRPP